MSAALGGLIASLLSWRALFAAYGVVAGLVAVDAPDAGATRSHERRDTAWYPRTLTSSCFRFAGRRALALYGARVRRRRVATSTIGFRARFCSSVMGFRMAIGGLLMINGISR